MNRRSKVISVVLVAIWCFSLLVEVSLAGVSAEELQKIESAVPKKATVSPEQPRKLLVFTLCKDYVHSSIPYATAALEVMGKKTGAFEVVQSEDMSIFKPENLEQFDAVCFNNTTKLQFKDPILQQGLLDFVKGGKGVVGIHAAVDNFDDWPEAAEMMGGLFDGHPWIAGGSWAVKLDDPGHPLTAAFYKRPFRINDEIYRIGGPYSRSRQRVLLSLDMTDEANLNAKGVRSADKDIPISWISSYGKGRVFYCSLGHNHHIFWNRAVLRHYLDGIQFAMGDLPADTTTPSSLKQLDGLLAQIASYDYGQSREPLTELSDIVCAAYGSAQSLKQIEKQFLPFLRSGATTAGKQFVCRQLSIIGTEESVPTLAAMLTETASSDMALYALQRIPGAAVEEALLKALSKTSGKEKIGIINTLGMRGDTKAVAALRDLILAGSETSVSVTAANALGQIAGPEATEALAQAKGKTTGELREAVLDAYLKCAEQLSAQGEQEQAFDIYKQLYAPSEAGPIRTAAFRGMIYTGGEKAVGIIIDTLNGDDQAMQTTAIGLVRQIPGTNIIEATTAELPRLSAANQVQLLSALSDRGERLALPAVVEATKNTEVRVRIAALKALGKLGDASNIGLLAHTTATASDEEQLTARESLYGLGGPKVDETILASMSQADPRVKIELIRSIRHRNISTAAETLLKEVKGWYDSVRLESLKALAVVAGPEHVPALVDILINVPDEAHRSEAEKAVIAAAHKIPDKSRQADTVLAAMPSVKDVAAKCSLLEVLGKIGSSNALAGLRSSLQDKDAEVQAAAIRALSEWPGAEPAADLRAIAQSSDNQLHRVLALRGFVHLVSLESERPAEETIKMLQQAIELALNVSEKKRVLSELAKIKGPAALEMAAAYLEDKALQQEAEAAVVKIAQSTAQSNPEQTEDALKKVIRTSENDSLRQQAQKIIDNIK